LDAGNVTYSNIAEAKADDTLSIHDLRVDVLSSGDCFDLVSRTPTKSPDKIR
jgi:cyanophycinase